MELKTVTYNEIKDIWPSEGKHILAQYNEKSIIVYQSFKPSIAKHAVENKCFIGCKDFSPNRCTWIKTNFLWMMYRCGWNTKLNQERTLAIELKIEFFEEILKNSVHSHFNDKVYKDKQVHSIALGKADVVMQWDPDHHPKGNKMQRRAIQLGLKGDILKEYVSGKSIISIQDITEFVEEQRKLLEDEDKLLVMKEEVYNPLNSFVLK
jgi:hypothetical protein